MSFIDRLFGREEPIDPTKGNWYDEMPTKGERYNHSPNRLINGGLRDILGALADAHSQSQGMDPVYAPKRKQERIGEAMDEYSSNPIDAINKIGKIDATMGQKYLDQYQTQQHRRDTLKSQDEARRAAAQDRDERQALQVQARFAGMLRAVDSPEAFQRMQPILKQFASKFPTAGIEVPDVYDSDWVTATVNGAMLPKDQAMMDYRGEALGERARHNRETEANNSIRTNTDREFKRAGVINNAAKTTISAANVGATRVNAAANTKIRQDNPPGRGRGLVRPNADPFAGAPPPPAVGKTLKANGQVVGVARLVNGKLQWAKP